MDALSLEDKEVKMPYPFNRTIKRRASAPELTPFSADNDEPYEDGKLLKLMVSDPPRVVTAKIIKCFKPFTMGQVMLVQILHPTFDLHQTYVLKVFDRRFTEDFRKENRIEEWTRKMDIAYHKFVFSQAHYDEYRGWLKSRYEHQEFCENEDEEDEDDTSYTSSFVVLCDETFDQYFCDRMYRSERGTYVRLQDLQGRGIPRLIAEVEVPQFKVSTATCTVGSNTVFLHGVRGILMQYIKGFSMQQMYNKPARPCPAPQKYWQDIVDDGIRILETMRKREILNKDSNVRNTIVRWDPIDEKYKVFLIDFGHCKFKHPDTDLWNWRKWQALEDEEGAISWFLIHKLEEAYGPSGVKYRPSDYAEALSDDFNRGD